VRTIVWGRSRSRWPGQRCGGGLVGVATSLRLLFEIGRKCIIFADKGDERRGMFENGLRRGGVQREWGR
jgi:hypothetical protein